MVDLAELGFGERVIDKHNNWPWDALQQHTIQAIFIIGCLQLGSI